MARTMGRSPMKSMRIDAWEATTQAATSSESCRIVKTNLKGTRGSRAPSERAKAMERAKNLEAARKNPPVYGERHAKKVRSGTREALPRTTNEDRNERTYKPGTGEVASCGKGLGGGHSTDEARTTEPGGGKDVERPYPTSYMGTEEVRASECRKG